MAITTGTANVQILIDTGSRLVAKFLYFTTDSTDEADVKKVNAAALAYASYSSTLQTRNVPVQAGLTMVGNTSGATASVVDWNYTTNTVQFTALSGNTAFAADEVVNFKLGSTTMFSCNTVNAAAAFTTPSRQLNLTSVWYSISDRMVVELGFGGRYANNDPFVGASMVLGGQGYFGKNALAARVDNAVLNPTGDVYVSTYSTETVPLAYTLICEFDKVKGYASPALG